MTSPMFGSGGREPGPLAEARDRHVRQPGPLLAPVDAEPLEPRAQVGGERRAAPPIVLETIIADPGVSR